MLPRVDGAVWMDDKGNEEAASWNLNRNNNSDDNNYNNNSGSNNNYSCGLMEGNKEEMGCLSTFKSMLEAEDDWYVENNNIQSHHQIRDITFSPNLGDPDALLLQQVDSSSSCSPSSSAFNNLDPSQVHYFLQPKQSLSSLLNVVPANPLEQGFDLGEIGFLENQATDSSPLLNRGGAGMLSNFTDLSTESRINSTNFPSDTQFSASRMLQLPENSGGFTGFRAFEGSPGDATFFNRSKLLMPLETFPSVGSQPTLFQKRAALSKNLVEKGGNSSALGTLGSEKVNQLLSAIEGYKGKNEVGEGNEKKRKASSGDDAEDWSVDGSGLNYDSDEFTEHKLEKIIKNGGNSSNANSTVTGGDQQKGKKKGLPAKNLMAERRRRKKLNDRLYMLRSVVPKISKMDRASILGDAIVYLKELLQRINDLHNELESTPPGASLAPTSSFQPLTPTATSLPSRIKDELCSSSFPSPNGQAARVEVRMREGRAVNIHMFCGRRPGLLLSTMRALDHLGLDIQQAVISCFNGFAMDIFRAEFIYKSPMCL